MTKMTLSQKALASMLDSMRITATPKQFKEMLAMFGSEPDGDHEWTAQDISEQIRKMVR